MKVIALTKMPADNRSAGQRARIECETKLGCLGCVADPCVCVERQSVN